MGGRTERDAHSKPNSNLIHHCTRVCHNTPLLIGRRLFMAPCLLNASILPFPSRLYIWLKPWRSLSVSSGLCLSPLYRPPFLLAGRHHLVSAAPSFSHSLVLLPLACFTPLPLRRPDPWQHVHVDGGLDKRREEKKTGGGGVSQSGRPEAGGKQKETDWLRGSKWGLHRTDGLKRRYIERLMQE